MPTTIQSLKEMTKNQIIEEILSPLVHEIEMEYIIPTAGMKTNFPTKLHLHLVKFGLDNGCYEKETTTH